MKVLGVTSASLGTARLHVSPISHLAALLRLAVSGRPHPVHHATVRRARTALARPEHRIVLELVPRKGSGNFPIVSVRPVPGVSTAAEELDQIAALDDDRVRTDLARAGVRGPTVAAALASGRFQVEVARAVHRLWTELLADDWPWYERLLADELARCGADVARHGWAHAIGRLHPSVGWLDDGEHAAVTLAKPIVARDAIRSGGTLVVSPNLFLRDEPLVTVGGPHHGIYYPVCVDTACASTRRDGETDPMARLVGTTRARIVAAVEAETTTTALARRLDLPLSTVATHLKVLHDAGVLTRRREGREVRYSRTGARGIPV